MNKYLDNKQYIARQNTSIHFLKVKKKKLFWVQRLGVREPVKVSSPSVPVSFMGFDARSPCFFLPPKSPFAVDSSVITFFSLGLFFFSLDFFRLNFRCKPLTYT